MEIKRITALIFAASLLILTGCENLNLFDRDQKMREEAEELTWLSENFPPYNYGETGSMSGVSIEVLEAIFDHTGISLSSNEVIISDWVSVYERVQREKGTVLFSMVKNDDRESLFKWVGPIAPHKEVIISQSGSGIKIQNDADLNQYFIGVAKGYPSKSLLLEKGVDVGNIIEYESIADLYQALIDFEIQCISYSEQATNLILTGLGEDPTTYSVYYTIQVDQLYYAFNKSVSNGLIEYLQEALDDLKQDKSADGSSTVEKILSKYSVILHADNEIPVADVIALVEQTASDLESNFSETIPKINNQEHPYRDQDQVDLYTFVYDLELNIVAHAANASLVGVNFKGKPDASGKLFRDEILAGAVENGTGWVDYIYTPPDKSGLYLKTTYYRLTTASNGQQYIVCSGKYK